MNAAVSFTNQVLGLNQARIPSLPATIATKQPHFPALPIELNPETGEVGPTWNPLRKRYPTPEEARRWEEAGADVPALIIGIPSGLEATDVDLKGKRSHLAQEYLDRIKGRAPDLYARLLVWRSKSNGLHLLYRCPEITIPGNLVIAHEYSPHDTDPGKVRKKALIETRGEGGYIIFWPAAGCEVLQGDPLNPPVLAAAERDLLHDIAGEFEEGIEHLEAAFAHQERRRQEQAARRATRTPDDGPRPGDVYNQQATIADVAALLQKDGATCKTLRSGKVIVTRPGKNERDGSSGDIAMVNGKTCFSHFSTSWPRFEPGTPYGPFGVYAEIEHGGDYAAAAKQLAVLGYGARRQQDSPGANGHQDPGQHQAPPGEGQHAGTGAQQEAKPRVEVVRHPWPTLDPAALYGPAGDIVAAIDPHTEADPVAVLTTFLVMFGNACGHVPHAEAGGSRHTVNENTVIVGGTSKARKGTSLSPNRRLFGHIDPGWASSNITSGLSSGEGLIYHVRDPLTAPGKDDEPEKVIDPGVADKRLLIVEEEFATTLRVMSREGNSLSGVMRQSWDHGNLSTLVKNSPTRATDAHISVIGHTTREEAQRYLSDVEAANGFANRILWVCARRSKLLPDGGGAIDYERLAVPIKHALDAAKACTSPLRRDSEAARMWNAVYATLSEGKPGLLGAMIGRAEAHALRFSVLYALLDRDTMVRAPHLEAALALWQYGEGSAGYIFGDRMGDAIADTILDAIRQAGDAGLDRTAIWNLFGRNQKADRIHTALAHLLEAGLIIQRRESTGGAPRTVFVRADLSS